MRSYKSVDQNFEKIRIFARFRHVALPALMAKMWPCKSLGRQGCMAKARENSVFFKILVHTFVRPHCFPFDVTLICDFRGHIGLKQPRNVKLDFKSA